MRLKIETLNLMPYLDANSEMGNICRILIVGSGGIGRRHFDIAKNLFPKAEIGILSRTKSRVEFGAGAYYFNNLNDALEFSPQISVVANPAPFHIDTADKLARSGSHLLVEKPLTDTYDVQKSHSLFKSCKAHNCVLLIGYNLRFLKSLQYFRDHILNNFIGQVLSFRCESGQFLPLWRPNIDYWSSVTANKNLGGGVLLELSHEIDYVRWIFGEPYWVNATISKQSNLKMDVEDVAHITVGCNSWGDGSKLIGTINLDCIRRDRVRNCITIGDKGSLRWDGLVGKVEYFDACNQIWREIFSVEDDLNKSYLAEWLHFINCINNKASPLITGDDGLLVMQIIDAVRHSSFSGEKVFIN